MTTRLPRRWLRQRAPGASCSRTSLAAPLMAKTLRGTRGASGTAASVSNVTTSSPASSDVVNPVSPENS